jgi:hypothetical protein
MFKQQYDSNNRKFSIIVNITCPKSKKIRLWAEDLGKPNSKYVDREILVEGKRSIYFSFPVSPKTLFIGALNADNPNDADFQVTLIETKLRDYNVWLDSDTEQFLNLGIKFCQVCGYEQASPKGRMFVNDEGKFRIRFYDAIRDFASGKILGTPARIGHQTGIIDIAKCRYDKYTIPMRMMILLHEFSHKYKNPKIGLKINDEVGADINALYIYLGLGFSKIDAICVYANVFLKAQTPSNIERMRKICDYINKFENQEFAYRN